MANATNFSSSGADTENIGVIITKTTICMFLLALSLAENSLVLLIFKLNFRNRLRSTNCYFIANMSLAVGAPSVAKSLFDDIKRNVTKFIKCNEIQRNEIQMP